MMAKSFTPLYLVQTYYFQILVTNLDPSIRKLIQTLAKRKLIPEKSELLEIQVKYQINKCRAVLLTYNLWISQKNEEMFLITAHHCEGLESGFLHICIPATTCTHGQVLANELNVLVKTIPEKHCWIHLNRRYKLGKMPDFTWKCSKKYRSICMLQAHISDELPCTCSCRSMQIWCSDSCGWRC